MAVRRCPGLQCIRPGLNRNRVHTPARLLGLRSPHATWNVLPAHECLVGQRLHAYHHRLSYIPAANACHIPGSVPNEAEGPALHPVCFWILVSSFDHIAMVFIFLFLSMSCP